MEQQFSLSWNNFHGNITKEFSSLLANSEFVDVTLAVDGQLLQAHKIVLSICSPYFKRMFKLNPCQHPIVVLRGVTLKAMKDLLQFMYHGEVSVRQEDLTSFISTAEILQIKGLTNKTTEDDSSEPQNLIQNNHKPHEICQTSTDLLFEQKSEEVSLMTDQNRLTVHHQVNNRLTASKRKSEDLQMNPSNVHNVAAPTLDIDVHSSEKKCKIRDRTLNTVRHNSVLNPRTKLFEYDNSKSIQYSEPPVVSITMPSTDSGNLHVQNEEHSDSSVDLKVETEEPVYSLIQRRYSDSILSNSQDAVPVNGSSDEHQQNKMDLSEKHDGILSLLVSARSNRQQLPVRYKYIFSRKGHKQLVHMNFVYTKHSTSHGKTSWRCVQYFSLYKCPATVETVGSMIYAINHQHNHEDCYDKLVKNEVYEEIVCPKD